MCMMFEDENLDIFTQGEFSTVALVNGTTELTGIFDQNYQAMFDQFASQSVEGRRFCFRVQTKLIEDLEHGDRLTIKDKSYQVVGIEPVYDGAITEIILKHV